MPYFQLAHHKVLFAHVPKCAGSSMTEMLIAHPACTAYGLRREGRQGFDYAVGKCPPHHWHASLLEATLRVDRFDMIFTIIRNPLKRLLSEHAMCLLRGDSNENDFNSWYAQARQLRAQDPFAWDNHLRPAVEFMLKPMLVYALEWGLSRIWEDVCRRLAIIPTVVAVKHIRPKQSVATPEEAASDATQRIVEEDYAADYALHRRVLPRQTDVLVAPATLAELTT